MNIIIYKYAYFRNRAFNFKKIYRTEYESAISYPSRQENQSVFTLVLLKKQT